ncbi:heat shock protein 30 [Xylogone sp. PMI_703]|nr:heat shock protein 30 [Xylogone sp. PMI_703]
MRSILARTNDALRINPPTADNNLTVGGSDWLWAVTAVYIFILLAVVGTQFFARNGERIFHYLFIVSLLVGSVTYFAQASDITGIPVRQVNQISRHPGTRQIFFARYINWFVGWVPLIIAIGLFSGVSWATIVYNIALMWIWVASWLSGAYVETTYKWGFFAFGLFAELLLCASLLHTGSVTARRLSVRTHYFVIAGWLVFLWLLYPIAYGLSDGGNRISTTSGFIFFGILDILTVPVIAVATLILARTWDYRNLNLYFTQYGRVAESGGDLPEREKAAPAAAHTTAGVSEPASATAASATAPAPETA